MTTARASNAQPTVPAMRRMPSPSWYPPVPNIVAHVIPPAALKMYFAWSTVGGGEASLTMVNWEAGPLAPAMFNGVAKRLIDLAQTIKAPAMLFTSEVLAQRRGVSATLRG
jgi:hypothetical protein